MQFPGSRMVLALLALAPLAACAPAAVSARDAVPVAAPSARPLYFVGGRVSGLSGVGLALRSSSGEQIEVEADGKFVFASTLDDGSDYEITVGREPISPVQSCTVERSRGRIAGRNAMDVTITCTTASFDDPLPTTAAAQPARQASN